MIPTGFMVLSTVKALIAKQKLAEAKEAVHTCIFATGAPGAFTLLRIIAGIVAIAMQLVATY
eukprot:scaffold6454_cov113-Isochrysis_galbana.AAC.1